MAFTLPPKLTLGEAPEQLQRLDGASADDALRIDAGALAEFDSSALALLLEAARRARSTGGRLQVLGAPAKLVELARLYGVADLLGIEAAAG